MQLTFKVERRTLLIPSTFTGEKRDAKIRIFLISQLARACVNFGINEIGVYYDPDPKFDSHGLGRFIVKVLKYLNAPPYLRKLAFPKKKEFSQIGAALPITAKYHELRDRYEYVYVIKRKNKKYFVSDGRKVFTVFSNKNIRSKIVIYDKSLNDFVLPWETEEYFGYETFYYNRPLENLLKRLKKEGATIIGTSRLGRDVRKVKLRKTGRIVIVFGSFARGLQEIIGKSWKSFFDEVINVSPDQNLKTLRTEEAVFYTLSIFKYLRLL